MKIRNTVLRGYYGEAYVIFKLAGFGLRATKMSELLVGYDLMTKNGARLEVKTSSLIKVIDKRRESKPTRCFWSFTNTRSYRKLQ